MRCERWGNEADKRIICGLNAADEDDNVNEVYDAQTNDRGFREEGEWGDKGGNREGENKAREKKQEEEIKSPYSGPGY